MGMHIDKLSTESGLMTEFPIGNAWRRAPCLGCGQIVKRARDSYATMIGTSSGTWIAALGPRAGRIYADTEEWPTEEPIFFFGVTHMDCGPRARLNLKTRSVQLPSPLPRVMVEEMHRDDPELNLQIPTPANTCPFCDEQEKDPSDEDIFPKWLLRELVKRGAQFKIGGHWSSKPIGPMTYACRDCNNTWMSTLEKDAQPTLLKLIDNAFDLSTGEQETVALWATMKAILVDTMSDSPVIPRGFGRDLKILRTPHEGVQVWIAAFNDAEPCLAAMHG